jgi:hypothetical protein
MQSIIEAETPHSPCVLWGERRQQHPNPKDLICHLVFTEYITSDNASMLSLGYICYALRQDGITIVGLRITGNETYKTLYPAKSVNNPIHHLE